MEKIGSNNPMGIKTWDPRDKPREKLRDQGCSSLSDAELIAILIGSGSREESAVALARRVLAACGHRLSVLARCSLPQLLQFKGIGQAKALTIQAAFELARRSSGETHTKILNVSDSAGAYRVLKPKLAHLDHEEFWVLYLNNANGIVHESLLSKGGITGTLVDVRLLFKKALEVGAVAMILAHNHPSGMLIPSEADKALTRKIQEGARLMDLRILDHLILSRKDYFSFADQNLLL